MTADEATQRMHAIASEFRSGKIKNQELESRIFSDIYGARHESIADACRDAAQIRAERIEGTLGISLEHIKDCSLDGGRVTPDGKVLPGIEMKIGAAMIPLGVAGPVSVHGAYANGDYYIPLATNEAALVAGLQRGIKAINKSGGIRTLVERDGMTRAPLLEAPDIAEARRLCEQVEHDEKLLARLRKEVRDPFVRLEYVEPHQLGTKVFLRLHCKTGDAMGMNGVTKAAADICRALLRDLPDWKLITISGNMCTDKKAAHVNVLRGRGKSVHAEVFVPDDVLGSVFRKGVTARAVERVVFHKCYLGSALSGTLTGFNVNAANTIAALFAATGQDLAQVVTSSTCFVQADAVDGGLHFMVSLPSLEVATTGGGTMFGTAAEALRMMGCDGRGSSVDDTTRAMRFAELAATAVSALDLNTACAQAASYEMADSHVKLARGEVDG